MNPEEGKCDREEAQERADEQVKTPKVKTRGGKK